MEGKNYSYDLRLKSDRSLALMVRLFWKHVLQGQAFARAMEIFFFSKERRIIHDAFNQGDNKIHKKDQQEKTHE